MTTFEIIKVLAKKRDISIKNLSQQLGFGESTIYKWKNQTPNLDHLKKVADYFDVSVDYLLGRSDNTSSFENNESTDLDELLDSAMSFDGNPISEHDKEIIRAYLEGKFGNK